jgi:hypothetical protein
MSKIGTAYLEATQDDMYGDELSKEAQLIRSLIDRSDATVDEAVAIGWALHDIGTSIERIDKFEGDLSPLEDELVILTARLTAVAAKAGNK